jgi:hypothetical protein
VLQTVTPLCTAESERDCTLADEYTTIPTQKQPGFCPESNEVGTADSTTFYRQIKSTLNTKIENIFTLPDDNGNVGFSIN